MVKSVLGVNHQGLRDWVIQRLSAILMAVYFVGLIVYLMTHHDLSYLEWRSLFTHTSMKIVTLIVLISLLWHAWIGIWTISTDYVNPPVLRFVLHTLVILMLIASFMWGIVILWSV